MPPHIPQPLRARSAELKSAALTACLLVGSLLLAPILISRSSQLAVRILEQSSWKPILCDGLSALQRQLSIPLFEQDYRRNCGCGNISLTHYLPPAQSEPLEKLAYAALDHAGGWYGRNPVVEKSAILVSDGLLRESDIAHELQRTFRKLGKQYSSFEEAWRDLLDDVEVMKELNKSFRALTSSLNRTLFRPWCLLAFIQSRRRLGGLHRILGSIEKSLNSLAAEGRDIIVGIGATEEILQEHLTAVEEACWEVSMDQRTSEHTLARSSDYAHDLVSMLLRLSLWKLLNQGVSAYLAAMADDLTIAHRRSLALRHQILQIRGLGELSTYHGQLDALAGQVRDARRIARGTSRQAVIEALQMWTSADCVSSDWLWRLLWHEPLLHLDDEGIDFRFDEDVYKASWPSVLQIARYRNQTIRITFDFQEN